MLKAREQGEPPLAKGLRGGRATVYLQQIDKKQSLETTGGERMTWGSGGAGRGDLFEIKDQVTYEGRLHEAQDFHKYHEDEKDAQKHREHNMSSGLVILLVVVVLVIIIGLILFAT